MPSLAVVFTKSQKVATVSEFESSPEERQERRSEWELLILMRYCKCPGKSCQRTDQQQLRMDREYVSQVA